VSTEHDLVGKKIGACEGIRTLDPNLGKGEIATSGYLDLLRNNALLCEGVRDLAAVSNRTGVKCNASGGKGVKAGTGNREVTAQAGFYRPCRFPTA
jgi:hypothetical protein